MVALSRIALGQTVGRQARLTRDIGILETAIATGKRLTNPSDAPAAWAELSDISRSRSDNAAARAPISAGLARAAEADRWLGALTETLTRARELTVAGGGTPGVGRAALVTELTAIRDDLAARFAQTGGAGIPILDGAAALEIGLGDGRITATVPRAENVRLLPDSTSLSAVLDSAIAAANSGDPADIAAALTALDAAGTHLATQQAQQGIRMARLEEAATLLTETDADLEIRQSTLADTDIAAAITMIQTLAVQRDAARAMLSRTASQTLFDYLR